MAMTPDQEREIREAKQKHAALRCRCYNGEVCTWASAERWHELLLAALDEARAGTTRQPCPYLHKYPLQLAEQAESSQPGLCELCGKPLPRGEEMFRFHGYSGPCPRDAEDQLAPKPEPPRIGWCAGGRYYVCQRCGATSKYGEDKITHSAECQRQSKEELK